MAQKPNILQPREPLLDGRGENGRDGKIAPETMGVNRGWWRFFNDLTELSGRLLNPLVVAPNSIISEGTFTTGGTIAPADIPSGTLLGNSGAAAAPATAQTVGPSLSLTGGVLGAATQAANTLTGNPQTIDATPEAIFVGANLTLDGPSRTLNASTDPQDQALAYSIVDGRAGQAIANQRLTALETQIGSINDGRAAAAGADQRITALESLVGSIADPRAEMASLRQRVDDALTLSYLGF